MNKKYELIYEGKAKKVFTHDDSNKVKIVINIFIRDQLLNSLFHFN